MYGFMQKKVLHKVLLNNGKLFYILTSGRERIIIGFALYKTNALLWGFDPVTPNYQRIKLKTGHGKRKLI